MRSLRFLAVCVGIAAAGALPAVGEGAESPSPSATATPTATATATATATPTFAGPFLGSTSITALKLVDADGNPHTRDDQVPAAGWEFHLVVGPEAIPPGERTRITDAEGIAEFDMRLDDDNTEASLTEVPQDAFRLIDVQCFQSSPPDPTEPVEIEVDGTTISLRLIDELEYVCTFVNAARGPRIVTCPWFVAAEIVPVGETLEWSWHLGQPELPIVTFTRDDGTQIRIRGSMTTSLLWSASVLIDAGWVGHWTVEYEDFDRDFDPHGLRPCVDEFVVPPPPTAEPTPPPAITGPTLPASTTRATAEHGTTSLELVLLILSTSAFAIALSVVPARRRFRK